MKFLDIVFPEKISSGSICGPFINTNIVETKNGAEIRKTIQQTIRHKYEISGNALQSREDYNMLKTLFMLASGQLNTFKFKDPIDNVAILETIGTGDGNKKIFQLSKKYTLNNIEYTRIISKPVLNSVKIYINNTEINNVTIDYNTGKIEFNDLPKINDTIYASFEFYANVRFDIDFLPTSLGNFNVLKSGAITLIEVE